MSKIFFSSVVGAALLSSGAFAADLPVRGPAIAPAPIFVGMTWSGFYIGAQVGYGWGDTRHIFNNGAPGGTSSPDGVLGGLHVGYNAQFGSIVLGAELDANASGGRGSYTNLAGITSVGTSSYNWVGTARLRAGVAFDRALIYVTGGVAYADWRYRGGPAPLPATGGFSSDRIGWTAGAGIEYAFTNNWSARAEYRYTDFERATGTLAPANPGVLMRVKSETHAVLFGLSYRFGGPAGAVVAKY